MPTAANLTPWIPQSTFGKAATLIREGGSIPIVESFKDALAPDENFPVENFQKGIILHRQLMQALAGA